MSFKPLEYKAVQAPIKLLETKAVDGETVYCGMAATYDIDSYDDRIIPGAFEETIQKRYYGAIEKWGAPDIKVYRNHIKGQIVGVITFIEERKSGPMRGLYVEWKFIDTTLGRDTKAEVDAGALNKLSIGYFVLRREYTMENGTRIRDLYKLDLPEFSIVDEPVNESAAIGRKGQETEPETKEKSEDMSLEKKAVENMRQYLVDMQNITTRALSTLLGDPPDAPDGPDHESKPSPFGSTKSKDCADDEADETKAKPKDGVCKACGRKMCADDEKDETKAAETSEVKSEEKEEKGLKNLPSPVTKQINDQLRELIDSI